MDTYGFLLDAPASATSRIPIAKLGDFKDGRYGEFSITRDDVQAWQRNLEHLPGKRALIDLDHRADRTPRNTEAAGWITGVDFDGDTPVAEVEWTPVGRQAIEDKRYLFFSPTYGPHKDETGQVHENTLIGGALTNRPFLNMPAITLASEERVYAAVEAHYDHGLRLLDVSAGERKLAVKEGNALPDGSYPIRNTAQLHSAAILAASGHGDVQGARKLIRRRAKELGVPLSSLPGFGSDSASDSRRTMDKALLTLLDLDENADEAKVLEAVTALKEKADEKPAEEDARTLEQQAADEGKVLLDTAALADLTRKANAGEEAAKQLAAQRFETSFERAVASGRAIPAQKEQLEHFYTLDAEGTLKLLDEGPQIVNVMPSGWNNSRLELDDGPAGVDPDAHKLDAKVKARLKELSKPMTEYPKVLEQMMQAGEL